MAQPGWYPDPDGTPGRYRYFDGVRWSPETRPAPAADARRRGRRLAAPTVMVAAAVVVIVVLIAAVLLRPGAGRATDEPALPSSTVSGWDDSSPTALPSARPTPTPAATGQSLAPCARGDPNRRDDHPTDGRVHGGGLSFAEVAGFAPAAPEPRLSFAYDVTQQYRGVDDNPPWIAQLAVGRLRSADGFDAGARHAAESAAQCTVSSNMYLPYAPERRDLRSQTLTVGGRSGWLVETDIVVDTTGLPFEGDRAIFVVVPDGRDWSLFFGAVPIGDADLLATLTRTVADLRID